MKILLLFLIPFVAAKLTLYTREEAAVLSTPDEQIFSADDPEAVCGNPLAIGEMRQTSHPHLCVRTRKGQVKSYYCNGSLRQQIIICGDGTIRSLFKNTCFTPNLTGDSIVSWAPCNQTMEH